MPMAILLVIACLLGGALYGAAKGRSGTPWGQPVAMGCAIALIAVSMLQMTSRRSGLDIGLSVMERQQEILGYGSAKLLVERFPGRDVILIPDPYATDLVKAALVRGLETGGGEAFRIAETRARWQPPPEGEYPDPVPGEDDGLSLGAMLHGSDASELVVFGGYFPERLGRRLLNRKRLPTMVVLGSVSPEVEALLANGLVALAIDNRTDLPPWSHPREIPSDPDQAFSERYRVMPGHTSP